MANPVAPGSPATSLQSEEDARKMRKKVSRKSQDPTGSQSLDGDEHGEADSVSSKGSTARQKKKAVSRKASILVEQAPEWLGSAAAATLEISNEQLQDMELDDAYDRGKAMVEAGNFKNALIVFKVVAAKPDGGANYRNTEAYLKLCEEQLRGAAGGSSTQQGGLSEQEADQLYDKAKDFAQEERFAEALPLFEQIAATVGRDYRNTANYLEMCKAPGPVSATAADDAGGAPAGGSLTAEEIRSGWQQVGHDAIGRELEWQALGRGRIVAWMQDFPRRFKFLANDQQTTAYLTQEELSGALGEPPAAAEEEKAPAEPETESAKASELSEANHVEQSRATAGSSRSSKRSSLSAMAGSLFSGLTGQQGSTEKRSSAPSPSTISKEAAAAVAKSKARTSMSFSGLNGMFGSGSAGAQSAAKAQFLDEKPPNQAFEVGQRVAVAVPTTMRAGEDMDSTKVGMVEIGTQCTVLQRGGAALGRRLKVSFESVGGSGAKETTEGWISCQSASGEKFIKALEVPELPEKEAEEAARAAAEAEAQRRQEEKQKEEEEAKRRAEAAREAEMDSQYERGKAMVSEERYEEALPVFEALLAQDADYRNSQQYIELCRVEVQKKAATAAGTTDTKLEEAALFIQRHARGSFARTVLKQRRSPEASSEEPQPDAVGNGVKAPERARDREQDQLDEIYERAKTLVTQERFEEALPILQKIMAVDPDYRNAASYVTVIEEKTGSGAIPPLPIDVGVGSSSQEAAAATEAESPTSPEQLREAQEAATLIQRHARGSFAKTAAKQRRSQDEAAMTIQARVRGKASQEECTTLRRLSSTKGVAMVDESPQDRRDRIYESAKQLVTEQRFEEALPIFQKIIDNDPGFRNALDYLVLCEDMTGKGFELDTAYDRAKDLSLANRHEEALPILRRIQAVSPEYRNVVQYLTHCMQKIEVASQTPTSSPKAKKRVSISDVNEWVEVKSVKSDFPPRLAGRDDPAHRKWLARMMREAEQNDVWQQRLAESSRWQLERAVKRQPWEPGAARPLQPGLLRLTRSVNRSAYARAVSDNVAEKEADGVLEKAAAAVVLVTFALHNMDYAQLLARPLLRCDFERCVKSVLATKAARNVDPNDVHIELACGSVRVNASIKLPQSLHLQADLKAVHSALRAGASGLGSSIVKKVSCIQEISSICSGPLSVDALTVQLGQTTSVCSQGTAPPLQDSPLPLDSTTFEQRCLLKYGAQSGFSPRRQKALDKSKSPQKTDGSAALAAAGEGDLGSSKGVLGSLAERLKSYCCCAGTSSKPQRRAVATAAAAASVESPAVDTLTMQPSSSSTTIPQPARDVLQQDAEEWLEALGPQGLEKLDAGACVITSLPDWSEVKKGRDLSLQEYILWFKRCASLIFTRLPAGGLSIFYQTDVVSGGQWVDKAALLCEVASSCHATLLWHKIVLEPENVGKAKEGKGTLFADYSHLLGFRSWGGIGRQLRPASAGGNGEAPASPGGVGGQSGGSRPSSPTKVQKGAFAFDQASSVGSAFGGAGDKDGPRAATHARNDFPDVLSRGRKFYAQGMGIDAILAVLSWLRKVRPVVRLVVDPFCGRGTVLALANKEGFAALGVEIDVKAARQAGRLDLEQLLASESAGLPRSHYRDRAERGREAAATAKEQERERSAVPPEELLPEGLSLVCRFTVQNTFFFMLTLSQRKRLEASVAMRMAQFAGVQPARALVLLDSSCAVEGAEPCRASIPVTVRIALLAGTSRRTVEGMKAALGGEAGRQATEAVLVDVAADLATARAVAQRAASCSAPSVALEQEDAADAPSSLAGSTVPASSSTAPPRPPTRPQAGGCLVRDSDLARQAELQHRERMAALEAARRVEEAARKAEMEKELDVRVIIAPLPPKPQELVDHHAPQARVERGGASGTSAPRHSRLRDIPILSPGGAPLTPRPPSPPRLAGGRDEGTNGHIASPSAPAQGR
eukprot:TRINITY_DN31901_c0_g1_i1.p1 TRINITY_DN31901_c0_g1~~TRINITY_DN31901_c0_g1_i1.p1  ORF type:complete len:1976 (+),score=558.16 TRINITY_DN31901_c0_g1_i1:70-5928(+)